ncbi:LPS O-antigen length regulator Wzz(fepE) [Kosakonia sacchari]|uniref:LPS O-antigen chain length determinant protein, WzzB/FepE family n=1 Tax=Kosakonia sacchari TaxID=1158459 RepID=A0A1G4Y107_9ENTR|nr:LPS O-antigen length regulator Wzz(fepE) [Kosakonia sacchari]AHJ76630.1 LPS O-antigen length regulator [Kosakonia sacchari SP1]MDN2485310.1 LPS O-antigen length regulator Wzz(fepE) [Kosakonia sacchari]NUL36735.1 LPS O-antigen length regulator [Kosakonia sacchari]SCX47030.1 LPS O-antigen chain length determinant protein, WzzB/FepE family [Kosakonia sacchari]
MSSLNIKSEHTPSFYENQPIPLRSHEIDLLNLVGILWKGKVFIIATVLLFAVAGFFIAALLPQKWTSQAEVTPAEKIQWTELQKTLVALQVLDVKVPIDANEIFNLFLKKFNSQSLKEEFLASSPLVLGALQDQNFDQHELRRAVVLLSEKIKAVNNIKPGTSDSSYASWSLSFTAPSAPEAQQVLKNYIDYVSALVVKETLDTLRSDVDVRKSYEKNVLEMDRVRITTKHDANIKRLNYSLEVANAAGIKRPVYSNGQSVQDDPDFSIALGADGIAEKLRIEKSLKDVTELNADFQNREYTLSELEKVNIKDIEFSPIKYQLTPSLPMKKDGAGKALILVLAAMIGGIISCGIVLLRHAMRQRNIL